MSDWRFATHQVKPVRIHLPVSGLHEPVVHNQQHYLAPTKTHRAQASSCVFRYG